MRHRWAILAAVWLPALAAHGTYVYSGSNIVNVAGSACRAVTSSGEASLYHDSGMTSVRNGRQRLLCPIPRRGTSLYNGLRDDGSGRPPQPGGTERRVKLAAVDVSGIDSSSSDTFTCFTFAGNLANNTVIWGTAKTMCSQSTLGCSSNGASWTGGNRMRLAAPSNLSNMDTANFGVICDIGPLSSLHWLEATITPN